MLLIFESRKIVLANPLHFLTDRVALMIHLSKFETVNFIYDIVNTTTTTAAIVVRNPLRIGTVLLSELHKFVSQQFTWKKEHSTFRPISYLIQ